MISVSWKEFQKIDVCVDKTPTHNTHVCSTVCSQARNSHHALGSSHTDCSVIFVRKHMSHPLLLSHHSLFLLPPHKNTQHNRDKKIISKNTQYIMHISMLSQSTSSAIKNHSGVKTCRVAETRARQLPQVMSPKSLRLSQGSKIILEIHINDMMHRKNSEKKITKLRSPKK